MRPVLAAAVVALGNLAGAAAPAAPAPSGGAPEAAPGPDSKGRVLAWKSKGGLAYEYFVPASYDPERGANLVLVFHGTGLDRRWTFANHPAGTFRPDDIVVSPDGQHAVRGSRSGPHLEAEAIGGGLAQELLERGAAEILRSLEEPSPPLEHP